jgi:PAS domain S-box-containing protein
MSFGPGGPEELVALAEDSPAMLWRGDLNGRCVYLNAAMRRFWGLQPDECRTFDWATSLLPEDQAAVFGPFSEGMTAQRPFVCEGRYRRADGEIRILHTRAHPYSDAEGRFAGMIGVNEDITDQRRAEAELRKRNDELAAAAQRHREVAERFRLATSISGLAMSEHDENLRYTWAHNIPADALGRTPSEYVGPDLGGAAEAILRRTLETGEPRSEELAVSVGGQRVWVDIQAAPISHPDGGRGVVASALDVTTRKLNEQKLQVLAGELGHRVKNVFAVVQAIIRQSASAGDVPPEFIRSLDARIAALSRAQDSLMTMADDRISLPDLLRKQLSHISGVKLDGPDVAIPGRLAPYVALAVHELGTNALKYGSLSHPGGDVCLSWTSPQPELLVLNWREHGGTCVREVGRKGFGSALLTRVFSAATGGSAELRPGGDGLQWTASIPLPLRVEASATG